MRGVNAAAALHNLDEMCISPEAMRAEHKNPPNHYIETSSPLRQLFGKSATADQEHDNPLVLFLIRLWKFEVYTHALTHTNGSLSSK